MRYRPRQSNEVEAVQWQGDPKVFQPWMDRYGSVPIALYPLPEITLIRGDGNLIVDVLYWIVRTVDGQQWFACPDDVFRDTYQPANARPPAPKLTPEERVVG